MAQERRVLLANGQYITIVQTTGNSTGDVMSQSAVTAALSTKANVSHTHNASAITGGTFGTARIADGAITTAKIQDKSITLAKLGSDVPISTTSYETVRVSGLTAIGTAAIGAKVTIGGVSYKFDSTGVVSAQIPYGQVYKIQANSNDAWVGDYNATFAAITQLRPISITYMVANGIYIEATDGTRYASSNWVSSKTPNSIVVVSDSIRFRMALNELSRKDLSSNYYDPIENYMTGTTSSATALSDYDGAGNTANILKTQPSTDYAAGYCNAYVFPDGKTKGYLPALGQLNLAYQNKDAIEAAIRKCGGTTMTSYYYWSSTFNEVYSNNRYCWVLHWSDGEINTWGINQDMYVHPFADYLL